MSQLYEYAIIYRPKPTRDMAGNDTTPPSVIVKDMTSVMAESESQVKLIAAKQIPDEYDAKLEQVEVVVRQASSAQPQWYSATSGTIR